MCRVQHVAGRKPDRAAERRQVRAALPGPLALCRHAQGAAQREPHLLAAGQQSQCPALHSVSVKMLIMPLPDRGLHFVIRIAECFSIQVSAFSVPLHGRWATWWSGTCRTATSCCSTGSRRYTACPSWRTAPTSSPPSVHSALVLSIAALVRCLAFFRLVGSILGISTSAVH